MMLSFLFLALFVFRADLCVFFLLRVYTRVYICFMWFCYIKACVSSCIFSRLLLLLLLLLLRFSRHDSLFYIPLWFFFHCVLCLISLLHRYDTSRCQLYYGGHKGGGAGVSTTRRGRPAAYITSHCMFFHLFYTLVRSIFSPTYFFLALAFFPFSPSISFFSKKKKAKNSSTRAFLGLSLTNLLFTLRRCYFVWFL